MGIRTYTPFLDMTQYFHPIYQIPPDEFHLVRIGLTKRILTHLFKGTGAMIANRQKIFDATFLKTRVFSDLPRRPRSIKSITYYKG